MGSSSLCEERMCVTRLAASCMYANGEGAALPLGGPTKDVWGTPKCLRREDTIGPDRSEGVTL